MPNILEQQDLLKGLPDDRLSTLMQNPTGDIPPFLVAAEAQRRQSIREQFSGGPQESVVDTLTKQLSNVPQNIQAPAQTPPQIPQMPQPEMQPEMGGVAALDQGMRRGGIVQRYRDGELVMPSIYAPAATASPAEQMAQTYMLMNPGMTYEEALQRASIGQPLPRASVGEIAASQAQKVGSGMAGIGDYSVLRRAGEQPTSSSVISESEDGSYEPPTPNLNMPYQYGMTAAERQNMPIASGASIPRDKDAGKEDTSTDNKNAVSVDEYRKYLETINATSAEDSAFINQKLKELYSDEGVSDWEKAQKWFAAAQAAIQPGQSNMQSVINALSALGGGYADERATERADKRALQEALIRQEIADRQASGQSKREIEKGVLDYRIKLAEQDRASESANAEIDRDYLKWRSGEGLKEAEIQGRRVDNIKADIASRMRILGVGTMITEEEAMKDPEIASLMKELKDIRKAQSDALTESLFAREGYGDLIGIPSDYETADGVNPITRSR